MGYLKPGQSKDERNGRNGMREGRKVRRSRWWFRSSTIGLTCGWVEGYFPTNIDILLATLANPMAAKLAADRVAEGCGRPGTDKTPATSKDKEAYGLFSYSPDGGQAPTW